MLVTQYQQKMFNTAIGMVQDEGVAEDITQEVFITVYRNIHTFNEQAAIGTWLYRITVNKCLDHLRAKGRQKRFGFFSQIFTGAAPEGSHDPPSFDHPGIKLEQKENARFLFEAIHSLPDSQKTAFILAQLEDMSQKEIADIMNISIKAVESLQQRAKANLRKKLGVIYDRRKNE